VDWISLPVACQLHCQELITFSGNYWQVAIFVSVAIGLIGAWLGFWGVQKLVLSEDGRVDAGTATFVKWAIRIVGCVMLLQVLACLYPFLQ
jgi:uncharacterized membrane protein YeaQ/YmgE (transglycosylase-associated protein family)